eukprot:2732018-Prymnesium_polylepis.1
MHTRAVHPRQYAPRSRRARARGAPAALDTPRGRCDAPSPTAGAAGGAQRARAAAAAPAQRMRRRAARTHRAVGRPAARGSRPGSGTPPQRGGPTALRVGRMRAPR